MLGQENQRLTIGEEEVCVGFIQHIEESIDESLERPNAQPKDDMSVKIRWALFRKDEPIKELIHLVFYSKNGIWLHANMICGRKWLNSRQTRNEFDFVDNSRASV